MVGRGNFCAKKGEGFSRKVSFYDDLCGGSYNFLYKFGNVRAKMVKKFLNKLRKYYFHKKWLALLKGVEIIYIFKKYSNANLFINFWHRNCYIHSFSF